MLDLPPTFALFLVYIGTSGFASWVVSALLEKLWPGWTPTDGTPSTVAPRVKQLIVLALDIGLALLSFWLVKWVPTSVTEQLQPIYAILVNVITTFLSSEFYHGAIAPAGKLIQAKARFALIGQTTKQEAIPPIEKMQALG